MRLELGSWGLSVALLASGCSLDDVDSDAIRTQGMFADMLALAPGDGTTVVRVRLTVGGENGTNVTLVGDDQLDATYGEVSARLAHAGSGRYQAELGGDAAGPVAVTFSRGPDDAPAGGTADLPEPFVLELATDASAGIDRGSEVEVTWSPAVPGGVIHWELDGRCLWSESGDAPDRGALVLGPERFAVLTTRSGEDCEVELTLERENTGDAAGVWIPGSRFLAVQRRGVSFVSTPAAAERPALPEEPAEVATEGR